MNYGKIYNEIIERRKKEFFKGYGENHHIIPKCMGGTNKKENIVRLTAREHFICHYLLTKIYPEHKGLKWAFKCMVSTPKASDEERYINSRLFESLKGQLKHSEETKQKISIANKNKKVSEETRKKQSIAQKGKKMSKKSIQKMKDTKNKIDKNGLSQATNSARKAMKTMKSRLWDGLSYEEHQRKINTGRKMTYEQIEKRKQYNNIIQENGKTFAENIAARTLKTRDAKIINGLPYREYCSKRLKQDNPMKKPDIIQKVKNTLHNPKYQFNDKLYTPLEYRAINNLIKNPWYIVRNVFNPLIEKIYPTKFINKKLVRNLRFATKEHYLGYSKNYCKNKLKARNIEWIYGCYAEKVDYENIKDKITLEQFIVI